jgi:hypothetical protein
MTGDQVMAFIGQILLAGGGGAVVAYVLISWLGKRWIEDKFAKSLEASKAAHLQELEKFKAQTNALFNQISKIHDKEFEILPNAWFKLHQSLGSLGIVAAMFKEYPDVKRYNDNELHELMQKRNFSESERERIMSADPSERNKSFEEIVFWQDLNIAYEKWTDFHNYLIYNKIFLNLDLFEDFTNIDKRLQNILIDLRYGKQDTMQDLNIKAIQEYMKFKDDEELFEIERKIQKRLRYQEA